MNGTSLAVARPRRSALSLERLEGSLFHRGKQDDEGGAVPFPASHVDASPRLGHDALRDRETKAGSLLLRRHKRHEQVG